MRDSRCVREGTCYPTNRVAAIFDRRQDADEAAEALRGAGFADVELFHGEGAYAAIREASQREGALTRAWRRIRDHGDEGDLHQHYLSALRRGGSYLIAYAATVEQASQARDIVVAHHAHDVWRLGVWTVERLPVAQLGELHAPQP